MRSPPNPPRPSEASWLTFTDSVVPCAGTTVCTGEPTEKVWVMLYVPGSPPLELKVGSAERWFAMIPPCEWPTIITSAPGGTPASSIAARTSSIAAGCCPATRRRFDAQRSEERRVGKGGRAGGGGG